MDTAHATATDEARHLGVSLAVLSAGGGLLVGAGWLTHTVGLVRSRPGPATLSCSTAAVIVALAIAAGLLSANPPSGRSVWARRVAGGAALAAGVIAVLSFFEDLTGRSIGIDQLPVRDHYSLVGHPGRMSAEAAVTIGLLGAGLAIEALRPAWARAVGWLGAAAGAVLMVAAVELAGADQQFFGLTGSARIALPTVVLLGLLAVALQICISDRAGAIWALWVQPSIRASMLRVFVLPLPLVAAGPLAIVVAEVNRHSLRDGRIVAEGGTATIGALIVVSALLGARAAGRVGAALTALSSRALRIAEGDLAPPPELPAPSGPNEVTELAHAFEKMRAELALVGARQELVREALEREQLASESLRQLDQLKNEFVGMVAHDLRSPMSIITGYADTLKLRWDVLTQEQREDFLATISRNTMGLATMVEDMLQAARIDSGEYRSEPAPFVIGPVVERTVAEVVQGFGGRTTRVSIPDKLPLVLADEQRVWQILTNLVSNACKFSGSEQPVEVTVSTAGNDVRVAVTDHGPGIAPGDQERIFEKFTRLGTEAGGKKVKGSGLGLYICRSLVQAQGGRLGVDSVVGQGSTFWFTMPSAGPINLDAAAPSATRVTASGGP